MGAELKRRGVEKTRGRSTAKQERLVLVASHIVSRQKVRNSMEGQPRDRRRDESKTGNWRTDGARKDEARWLGSNSEDDRNARVDGDTNNIVTPGANAKTAKA